MIENKSILIIGGTGDLGKNLVEKYHKNNNIIIFSRNEHKQEEMKLVYPNNQNIKYRLGDVRDKGCIVKAINLYKPNIIINASALKTVWVCQDNPYESVEINIIGHQHLIEAVQESNHKIETLIFTSTDKACKPINVYGMSKAIAEQLYVNFTKKQDDISVVIVRYGNVALSHRSLIPYFKRLIVSGKQSLPITNFEMTRFFITFEQAINLIENTYNRLPLTHGKIAIPKLKSLKIVDIANELIKQFGNPDIKLEKTFIKNGEKLHEEMISEIEFQRTTELWDCFLIGYENMNEDYEKKPYNSAFNLVPTEEVRNFLKELGALL